jgi:nicotinate-nucleotide adenylyltransferase
MQPEARQRIGVFGGTFDPVHVGHLILAEQCREQGRLDEVWFVPSARPPHKLEWPLTPFAQRVEMLSLAIAGNAAFRIDASEKDRPGPSYTADTLAGFLQRLPGAEFFLVVGSDTLADLPHWREPLRVVERAALLVVERPNCPVPPADELRAALRLPETVPLRQQVVQAPLIDISSRDLRRRAAAGRSLRYFVPRAVECYIAEKRLYQGEPGGGGS